jgi:DNA-binding NarL/FixJ family response regulator
MNPATADDLLTAIRRTMFAALVHHGIDPCAARCTADQSCRLILEHWGGAEHWLPSLDRHARDSRIIEAVRAGKHPKVIAAEVVCSISTVKRVVRQSSGLGRDDWVL